MKRRIPVPALVIVCAVYLCLAGEAHAGSIVLQLRTTLAVFSDRIDVTLAAANYGSEPARDVRAVLQVFDRSLESGVEGFLGVGQTRSFEFRVPVPQGKQGRFPVTGEILYHDANHHPFSAVSCDAFDVGGKTRSDLSGFAPDLEMTGIATLDVLIKNRSPVRRSGTATLYLPHGIAASAKQKRFEIAPGDTQTIDFQLTDRYDTGGAEYHAFCVLAHEENGVHHTEIVHSRIRVSEFHNWFEKTRWYWLALMVPIVLVWISLAAAGSAKKDAIDAIDNTK